MRWFRYAVFILAVTVLQASRVLDLIAVTQFSIKPDLLLVLMVFLAINCGPSEAIILSFATGFAADIIDLPIGPHIISFGLLGSLLVYVRNFIMVRKMLRQAIVIFLTSILAGIVSQLLAWMKGQPGTPNIYSVFLGNALYSAVLGPYVCSMFSVVAGWMGIVRKYRRKYRFARTGGTLRRSP